MKQLNRLFFFFFILATYTAQGQGIADSLYAHYNFEGNILDETAFNHDLEVVSGSISYDLVNPNDSAIFFDGNSTISTIGNFDNSSFDEMSVALWIKSDSITNALQICFQGSYIGFGAYIQANSGKFLGFFDGSSSGGYESTTPITDNVWHHVVMQTDGSTTSVYIDGVFDGNLVEPFYKGTGVANNKFYFGKSNLGAQYFTGSLNDVRVYNRQLSLAEIDTLYSGGGSIAIINLGNTAKIDLSIYPNPTQKNILLDLKKEYENVQVIITDALGRKVYQEAISNQQYLQLALDGPAGIYFISVAIENELFTYQVVKE